jgi:hypothetical protein
MRGEERGEKGELEERGEGDYARGIEEIKERQ